MYKKLTFSHAVVERIDTYMFNYRTYFRDLYMDSGVWGEDIIIENYIQESLKRRDEIYDLLERRLSGETVLGRTPANTIFIGWRSKILFVEWTETDNTRTITHLQIR